MPEICMRLKLRSDEVGPASLDLCDIMPDFARLDSNVHIVVVVKAAKTFRSLFLRLFDTDIDMAGCELISKVPTTTSPTSYMQTSTHQVQFWKYVTRSIILRTGSPS